MSLRNRLVLPVILFLSLSFLVACGNGTPSATPPPNGGFSVSDLKGTYVFSTSGSDGNGSFIATAGIIMADGNGGITGGTIDINDSDINISPFVQAFGVAINNSSYSVGVDGRGKLNIATSLANFTFDFVLNSSSGGLITEFDGFGSGSGTLELQAATITQAQLQQGYAISFSGADLSGFPLGGAAAFSLDQNGNVTGGVYDLNDNQTVVSAAQLVNGSGLFTLNSGGGSGTASLSNVLGTLHFDFFVVDATHLKFIETDLLSAPVVSGDMFQQSASIPTGTLVFTMAGESGLTNPLAFGGFMTSTAPSQNSNGVEDVNSVGTVLTQVGFTLNYTAPTNGRSTMALSNFSGGPTQLAVYPTTGGLLMLEIDNGSSAAALSSGVAYAQSSTALQAAPQGYGLNLSGLNGGNGGGAFEVDDIAEFKTAASGGPSGLLDENDEGSPLSPQSITNTSILGPDGSSPLTGRGTAQFCSGNCSNATLFDLIYYTVDGTNTLFIETDGNQIAAGSFQQQSSTGSKAAASTHPVLVRPLVVPRAASKHASRPALHAK